MINERNSKKGTAEKYMVIGLNPENRGGQEVFWDTGLERGWTCEH